MPSTLQEDFPYKGTVMWTFNIFVITVQETKFLEHSPENSFPLDNLYKIPLAQAQLKMHSHRRVCNHYFPWLY